MFSWEEKIKVRKMNDAGMAVVVEASPMDLVTDPNRYQSEDIIRSLTIVVKELSTIAVAQAEAAANVKETLAMGNNGKDKPKRKRKYSRKKSSDPDGAERSAPVPVHV